MSGDVLARQFLGPSALLLPWMRDPLATDLLINGTDSCFVERQGKMEGIANPFTASAQLMDFIERILVPLGKRVDAARPYVDGSLADGSRFHLILPPLARGGPQISIRKRAAPGGVALETFGAGEVVQKLKDDFCRGKNILISGGTGAGKTTLLSCLLDSVPVDERLIVVEETAEIVLCHPHAVFLEARQATPDGVGEVSLRTLIRNALRMRPSRLVLGECRGNEAWELLQAMNTGHRGSACTLHANSPIEALRRLETLVLMAGMAAPHLAVREWISGAVGIVVQVERVGSERKITAMLEILGMEGERYRIHPYDFN